MIINNSSTCFNNYKIEYIKPSFKGLINKVYTNKIADSIVKTTIDNKIELLYQKIKSSLTVVEPSTIDAIIKRFSDFRREEVLEVMQALSSYSNIMAFDKLQDEFNNKKYSSFHSFIQNEPVSKHVKKYPNKAFIVSPFDKSKPVTLNEVFNYLYTSYSSKFLKIYAGEKEAIILDKPTLEHLETLKQSSAKNFRNFIKKYDFYFIKNLENSYNIFNQSKDFESVVNEKLLAIQELKKENPSLKISELIDINLNGENLDRANNLGIKFNTINLTEPKEITSETIANNLSSIIPSKDVFKDNVNDSLCRITNLDFRKKIALDILQEKNHIYTFKSMAKKLQKLKELIENEVKENGKDINKIYYNVPLLRKSFSLINYMYQKINNIPPEKFIYCDTGRAYQFDKNLYDEIGRYLPKSSTLVTLDDAIISGNSLFIRPLLYKPDREVGDYDMIFASLYSTKNAKIMLAHEKQHHKNNDKIISVDNENEKCSFWKCLLIGKTDLKERPLIMFPYMTPDNNSADVINILKLFYPSGGDFVKKSYASFVKNGDFFSSIVFFFNKLKMFNN